MYYKTLRVSETGKKFAEIERRIEECRVASIAMAEEIGYEKWRGSGGFAVEGGVSCVMFAEGVEVDMKVWKKKNDGYYPRQNRKEGAKIIERLHSVPKVFKRELNDCIGYENDFQNIGYSSHNPEYYLFVTGSKMDITIPDDCVEITSVEYKQLAEVNAE